MSGERVRFFKLTFQIQNAMGLPENESEPINVANSIVTAKNVVMPSGLLARFQKFQARDQRRRAAAHAVEHRDHLRHRGHFHRVSADGADDQTDHECPRP